MELQGAAAIVTGGASGIGAACVTRLRKAGARVAVLDLVDAPDADLAVSVDVAIEQEVVDGIARAVSESHPGISTRMEPDLSTAEGVAFEYYVTLLLLRRRAQ